jgi:hypothetical protein
MLPFIDWISADMVTADGVDDRFDVRRMQKAAVVIFRPEDAVATDPRGSRIVRGDVENSPRFRKRSSFLACHPTG